jgi:hypothetical protein
MKATVIFILAVVFCPSLHAADYYIDPDNGNDQRSGLSEALAWKSPALINSTTFKPGDRLLLRAGSHLSGQLCLKGSGTKAQPIELSRYGAGSDPRIDGEGQSLDTLLLQNVNYWLVHHLEITNHGQTTAPFRTGVRLESDDGQTITGLHLDHLFVHDVNGDLQKEKEGCGVFFDSHGHNSNFDDLLIENCHILRTDRNGLCQRSLSRTRSTHVIVRNNLLEDIGGDGIKLWGTDGGLIEHNTLHGGRMRCDDYAAGIWPFACNNTMIQFNEVSGMKGVKDGQGFDSDYVCKNSIFQYNYSHNNDGGFMLICAPGSSYCDGTIIRYNISQDDGQKDSSVFHFGGHSSNTLVHNNVIYLSARQNVPLLRYDEWDGGSAHHTTFLNNIFYAQGRATYQWGKSVDNVFDHNVFFGQHLSPPKDDHAITIKPSLVNIGSGKDGFDSLTGYAWSVQPMAGIIPPDQCKLDFFGNAIPATGPVSIGVSQK